jgi:hypothetical protein
MQIIDYSTVGMRSGNHMVLQMVVLADKMENYWLHQHSHNLCIDSGKDTLSHKFARRMCLNCINLHFLKKNWHSLKIENFNLL